MHLKPLLYIHAPNIHQGGGRVLLLELLTAITEDVCVVLHADARMNLPDDLPTNVTIHKFKPTLFGRWLAERKLYKNTTRQDSVLCFNGLPPLFKNKAEVTLFLQNRYMIDNISYEGMSLWVALRVFIERVWTKLKRRNVDTVIVQTSSMYSLAAKYFGKNASIKKSAFIPNIKSLITYFSNVPRKYDFIYVASPEAHKNHIQLIEAWRILAAEDIYPTLCLTFNPEHSLHLTNQLTQVCRQFNLKIENIGVVQREQIVQLYQQSRALIFPSKFESLGLPLLEAKQLSLPILAGELDYVRDTVNPVQTFDPNSPVSIARAVKRFLGIEQSAESLMSANEFLTSLRER